MNRDENSQGDEDSSEEEGEEDDNNNDNDFSDTNITRPANNPSSGQERRT